MGVKDVISALTDGGRSLADTGADVHYECRRCSRNLSPEHDSCPECGGGVAVYELD